MLKAINYGQVWSEDRKIIIKKDREYISYKENDYALRVGVGRRSNPHTIVVDCDDIEGWFPPHHHEPMTEAKKIQALKRIEEALKLWGDHYHLQNKPIGYD